LDFEGLHLFAKLEFHNPIGSLKDRPAFWILKSAIERSEINGGSTIIESSSGNFAVALASYCRMLGLSFIPVVDPNLSSTYESFLQRTCDRIVKVNTRDDTGGFLKTRLQKVKDLCQAIPGAYWTNQYGNLLAMEAHYHFTGGEICSSFDHLDFVFVGVSTAGTIAGVSRRLKERFPSIKVIAVDAQGSVSFGGKPCKRHIPGIGSSIHPEMLKHALIDDVVVVPEVESARACQELLLQHGLFVGGSSGSAYAAVKRYFSRMCVMRSKPRVLFLCADRGTAYLDTVFNNSWVASKLEQDNQVLAPPAVFSQDSVGL
jgi:2,3-diaminopropionate biosynthesis protein SbnA